MKTFAERLAVACCCLTLSLLTNCSYIKIKKPAKEERLVITPYTLEVEHTGCGKVKEETFEASLHYKPTGETNDISNAFDYSNETWTASDYPMELWGHTLSAKAGVDTGGFCYVGQGSDERDFYVAAPTCVEGIAKWRTQQAGGGFQEGIWAGARIDVYVSRTHPEFAGQFLGTTVSDESGRFCIDRMPVGIPVDVKIPGQAPPPGATGDSCSGTKDNILPVEAMKTCAEGNCTDAGDVAAYCWVD